MENNLPIYIAKGWRITWADEVQWKLERLEGKKKVAWAAQSFCRSREGLELAIRHKVKEVGPACMRLVGNLPEWREL